MKKLASRPARPGGAPRAAGGSAASATHARGSDAEGQLAGIAERVGSPCSSATTEANNTGAEDAFSDAEDDSSPDERSCVCTKAPAGLSPSARAMAIAEEGRSTTETTSADHRGSRLENDSSNDSSDASSHAYDSRTVNKHADPSLGRSAATSAVSASSQATRLSLIHI